MERPLNVPIVTINMEQSREFDLKTLAQGEPFLRYALAFLIYLRFGTQEADSISDAYVAADIFTNQLTQDLKG